MPPKFKVAICGGGIGGLTLALVLDKYSNHDIEVDVYESKSAFSEIGAGLSIWKRTWQIIKNLGLETSLGEMAITPPVETPSNHTCYNAFYLATNSQTTEPGFAFRKSDQRDQSENFYRIISPYGSITVHRADMLKVLVDNFPKGFRAHFSKHLVAYTDYGDSVTLHFADGTTAQADLMIGADGVKSTAREIMYSNLAEAAMRKGDTEEANRLKCHIQASWTGTYAYRSLLNVEKFQQFAPGHQAATVPLFYLGKDRHIVSYPISRGKLINLIGFVSFLECEGQTLDGPSVVDVPREDMIEPFSSWEPEARMLMEGVEKSSRWAICHVRNLPKYVSGRVALLGDAAHAMTTHIGAGAGQAIEDAYVLGRLLSDMRLNASKLESALQVYDSVRRPIGNSFVEHSRTIGLAYEFNYVPEAILTAGVEMGSPEGLKLLSEFIYDSWSWHWRSMPEEDWLRAEQMLHIITSRL